MRFYRWAVSLQPARPLHCCRRVRSWVKSPLEAAKCERRPDGSTEMRIRIRTVGESAREVRKPVGGEDWLPVRVNVRIYGPAQRRAPSSRPTVKSGIAAQSWK